MCGHCTDLMGRKTENKEPSECSGGIRAECSTEAKPGRAEFENREESKTVVGQ